MTYVWWDLAIREQCVGISRDKMSPGHEFLHHQVGSPRGDSLNLAERRRATEDLTERKEVLGERKSIVGEGSLSDNLLLPCVNTQQGKATSKRLPTVVL